MELKEIKVGDKLLHYRTPCTVTAVGQCCVLVSEGPRQEAMATPDMLHPLPPPAPRFRLMEIFWAKKRGDVNRYANGAQCPAFLYNAPAEPGFAGYQLAGGLLVSDPTVFVYSDTGCVCMWATPEAIASGEVRIERAVAVAVEVQP